MSIVALVDCLMLRRDPRLIPGAIFRREGAPRDYKQRREAEKPKYTHDDHNTRYLDRLEASESLAQSLAQSRAVASISAAPDQSSGCRATPRRGGILNFVLFFPAEGVLSSGPAKNRAIGHMMSGAMA
jgi:hypothetical protein